MAEETIETVNNKAAQQPGPELRSGEVVEILGRRPIWLIRWGIVLFLGIVVLIVAGSWLFKYPEVITGDIELVTELPPAFLHAKSTGKIANLLVADKQKVSENQLLCVIENPARLEDVILVDRFLDSIEGHNLLYDLNMDFVSQGRNLVLGDVQEEFKGFVNCFSQHRLFFELEYFLKQVDEIKNQIREYKNLVSNLQGQYKNSKSELALVRKQYIRDSVLFAQQVIAASDFEASERVYLEKKVKNADIYSSIINTRIQIDNLNQKILEYESRNVDEGTNQKLALQEAYKGLKNKIADWGQKYLIRSPISGQVTFSKIWAANQYVEAGDLVFAVVPSDTLKLLGKLDLAVGKAGKVNVGQRVNIKVHNYPYLEYGMLKGAVSSISLVSSEGIYKVDIVLANGLVTNYGIELPYTQKLTGKAEIITRDLRLMQRVVNPLKHMVKKQKMLG